MDETLKQQGGNHGFATPPQPQPFDIHKKPSDYGLVIPPLKEGAVIWNLEERQNMQANDSRPVLGEIGRVECINVARAGEPEQLRYFGRRKGATGQARATEAEAQADVVAWHQGKPAPYDKHAEVPLAEMKLTGLQAARQPSDEYPAGSSFVIGENNTWPQAWEALLAGHRVRQPEWTPVWSWLLERNTQELLIVEGDTPEEWRKRPIADAVPGRFLLATNWVVLPKVHPEQPTI